MKAMILAAGLGTRLRPLTDDLPKALLPVNGRPMIHYTLMLLKKYGITDVIINLHHQGQKIMDTLKNGSDMGIKITYSFEPEILGTGGGIKKVQHLLSEGPFLVINSDILIDIHLDEVITFHKRKKAIATLVLREDRDVDTWGVVEINASDQVRRILGQPSRSEPGLVKRMFTGIHVMDPRVFRYLPGDGYHNIMDAYLEMIRNDERIIGYGTKGYWMDIGTPDRYQKTQQDLHRGVLKLSYLHRS
jgi:NDP-sugar pyrophosphorylase family protein